MSIRSKILRKIVEQKVSTEIHEKLDNQSLSVVSKVVRGQIKAFGVDIMRPRVIKTIEDDLRREAKKRGQAGVDKMLQEALNTPAYMDMLKDLGMGEEHLRLMAKEATDEK